MNFGNESLKYLHNLVESAIKHEETCNCRDHREGRRLSDGEKNSLRIIFSTKEGYAIIMGIVAMICSENSNAFHSLSKNIMENVMRQDSTFEDK